MTLAQIQSRCPHCGELGDFIITQATEIRDADISTADPPFWKNLDLIELGGTALRETKGTEFCAISRCPHCFSPTMLVLVTPEREFVLAIEAQFKGRVRADLRQVRVVATFPKSTPIEPKTSWPEEIRRVFNDTRKLLRERKDPFFILAGCRTTLDIITLKLGANGKRLIERIDDLAKKSLITEPLRQLAHQIRIDGNESLHEAVVPDEETATRYVAFLELMLHVCFELPAEIEERAKPSLPTHF
jgi:hypothetical protein